MALISKEQLEQASQNADSLDIFVNSDENTSVVTRLGKIFPTLAKLIKNITNETQSFFNSLGYSVPVAYASGLNLTAPNQTVSYQNVIYAPNQSALPFTTTGTFETAKFRVIQNSVSFSDLSDVSNIDKGSFLIGYKADWANSVGRLLSAKLKDSVSVKDFGAVGNGIVNDTLAVATSITQSKSAYLPEGLYKMTAGTIGQSGGVLQLQPGARFVSDSGDGALSFADNSGITGFNEGADRNTWYWGRKFSGARANGVGVVNAGFSPVAFMYDVRSDSSDCGGTFSVGFTSRHIFGGNATKGGRIAINGTVEHQDGATNTSNNNRNYVGTQGTAYAQGYGTLGGDGGTAGNEKGGYFGLAGAAYVNSLARYVFDATGAEFNTFIGTGTVGLKHSSGISVIGVNAARATKIDCAIRIAGQSQLDSVYTGHIGWLAGITFTDANGADPLFSGGSIMNTQWANGARRTIGRGLDFDGFNITEEVIRSGAYMRLFNDHLYLQDNNGFSVIEPNGPSVNANILIRGRGTGLTGIGNWASSGDATINGYITVCDHSGNPRKIATFA